MSRIIKPGDRAFYINRKRYYEVESHVALGIEAFYTCKAIKPGFGVVRETEFPAHNLITNIGMDALGSSAQFARMHLGTGTTPPDFTDTGLGLFGVTVGNGISAQDYGVSGSAPYFGWARLSWQSGVGEAVGNWTEIGISNVATNSGLRSHALILDAGSNPTVFPVQSDEQFQGAYEFRIYAPSADALESVSMSGNPHDTTTRAIRVNTSSGVGAWAPGIAGGSSPFTPSNQPNGIIALTGGLVPVTGNVPDGSSLGFRSSFSSSAYTPGSHYRDSSARWGSGGAGNMRSFLFCLNGGGSLQIEYDPAIAKGADEEVIINQRVSWARR